MVEWDSIISATDAAEMLGLSVERVKKLCRDGRLEAKKLSIGWIIWRPSVEERLANPPRPGRPRKE